MNMSAYLLSCLCGPEDSNDRDSWCGLLLRRFTSRRQLGIELGWRCLVMVDAVESDAKEIHRRSGGNELPEQSESERMTQSVNEQ